MAELSQDQLHQLCKALGWQGGTFWQVLAATRELREAGRQFHNLTLGDPEVIIRPPSAQKRDAIVAAGERLRAALAGAMEVPDAERLDWLMREISGAELRRLGVVTSSGMNRELLDRAMAAAGAEGTQ